MKRSFLFILVASALLLNSARGSAQIQSTKTQTPSQDHRTISTPRVSAVNQPTAAPTPKQSAGNTYNYYYPPKESGDSAGMVGALATLGLLIFAGWQTFLVRKSANAARDAVVATERYVELTKEMSEAAKQSARAAELALNAERPYLFLKPSNIEDIKQTVIDPLGIMLPDPYKHSTKTITVKWLPVRIWNRGKGVAIVEEIYIRPCVVSRKSQNISKGGRLTIRERVIGADKYSDNGITIPDKVLPPLLETFHTRFAVVGYVRYRDVYDRRYKSTFGYYYHASSNILMPDTAYFYLAAEKHNRDEKEKTKNTDLSKPE